MSAVRAGAVGRAIGHLRRPPFDPWARPYVYSVRAWPAGPQVISPGPDGTLGTADDIASP